MNFKAELDTQTAVQDKALRLQVYLAHAGVASRRSSEVLITAGRVSVNGRLVFTLGEKVLPTDTVCVDGIPVVIESSFHYIALNKPPGYLCSVSDPEGRRLAKNLLPPEIKERLYNVGRLDYLSCGLIIFTNDGDFAAKVSHPSAEIEKEYIVEASGLIPDEVAEEFANGVMIDGVLYRAEGIERLGRKTLRIVLIEGKNREIRRVFSHFRLHPLKLQRIRIGLVTLGNLEQGKTRSLTSKELKGFHRGSATDKNGFKLPRRK
ncbi:MAG: rRNA pseudouridine synthase [Treponema sp.]|nr:rRNA pseudouridine synthase [Treponema sp.]